MRSFLAGQIRSLSPFDFVRVSLPATPGAELEVVREYDGNLRLWLAAETPEGLSELQRASLDHLGYRAVTEAGAGTRWQRPPMSPDATAAAGAVEEVLTEVFAFEPGAALDLRHGNSRAEYEIREKMEALRGRVEPLLADLLGHVPTRDTDGDWVFPYESAQIFVAVRATTDGTVVVRVFAVTNAGLPITPQLALFIANLNFNLTFGRFALDLQHGAVWVDEVLLGDYVADEEIRFAVKTVASTAADWDARIQQLFGGVTAKDVADGRLEPAAPGTKPHGGYL